MHGPQWPEFRRRRGQPFFFTRLPRVSSNSRSSNRWAQIPRVSCWTWYWTNFLKEKSMDQQIACAKFSQLLHECFLLIRQIQCFVLPSIVSMWCSAVWEREMQRIVVEDLTIFASQQQLQRFHSRYAKIVLFLEPLLVNGVLPVWKTPQRRWATLSLVISRHDWQRGAIVDNFQFTQNKVHNVIFTIFIIFPSGGFLRISQNTFLLLPLHSISKLLWQSLVGQQGADILCLPSAILHGSESIIGLTRSFYCCALKRFFLEFGQWLSSTDRILTLYTNILLQLFWALGVWPGGQAHGQWLQLLYSLRAKVLEKAQPLSFLDL